MQSETLGTIDRERVVFLRLIRRLRKGDPARLLAFLQGNGDFASAGGHHKKKAENMISGVGV